jgi:hypothetical protein
LHSGCLGDAVLAGGASWFWLAYRFLRGLQSDRSDCL